MPEVYSVGQVADRYNVRPSDVSNAVYCCPKLRAGCQLVGRSRLIPRDLLEVVRDELVRMGKLRGETAHA